MLTHAVNDEKIIDQEKQMHSPSLRVNDRGVPEPLPSLPLLPPKCSAILLEPPSSFYQQQS